MIFRLRGNVVELGQDLLLLDVGGVGYGLQVSAKTADCLPPVGEEAVVFVHTHVREDALSLYGFSNREEKELFLLLVSVSGIGPRVAMAFLSGLSVADICDAIVEKDLTVLTSVSGVGKKTAQRVCMELGEKVAALGLGGDAVPVFAAGKQGVVTDSGRDALSALLNLGYSEQVARKAIAKVNIVDNGDELDVSELIRLALQELAK